MRSANRRIARVTEANKGIGFEIARQLGRERTLRTNFLGTLTVTQALLPLPRKSSGGAVPKRRTG